MESKLKIGETLITKRRVQIKVLEELGEGGQGTVYKVEYRGVIKALKWYKPSGLPKNPKAFYMNILENIKRGRPSDTFLWPEDITEYNEGSSFGYIMGLKPDGYYDITDYMLTNVRFKSYSATVNAALRIVDAFRRLHNDGYSYHDLNDGNFFINNENGKVLICDTDNIAPTNAITGIVGKPRYMAPEIVRGDSKPNSLSDRFSMTVILYILFCLNHPLEGKRYFTDALTPKLQEKLYGTEPLFMFDKYDNSNAPDAQNNINSIVVWNCLPKYIKDIFWSAFSQESFVKPSRRPSELDWLKELSRFRSEIVPCSCGRNELFTDNAKAVKCEVCGKIYRAPFRLELRDYSIPTVNMARLYRCQLGVCNVDSALDIVAGIIEKPSQPGVYGLRNKTGRTIRAFTPSGVEKKVSPEQVIPFKDGISIIIDNETLRMKNNN